VRSFELHVTALSVLILICTVNFSVLKHPSSITLIRMTWLEYFSAKVPESIRILATTI